MSTTEKDTETDEYSSEYWNSQLEHARKLFEPWEKRGKRVVDRFRDERDTTSLTSKFNILWSNFQVLKPSLYGRQAKPEVSRRYMDADPAGRLASTMLERVLDYESSQFPDFHAAMDNVVEDRLLPGRGTAWIRFDPSISSEELKPPSGLQITTEEPVTVENVDAAHSPVDYVYWKDFLHSPARTWEEVWWCARRVYMGEEDGEKRFGELFLDVPLKEYKEDNSSNSRDKAEESSTNEKAEVWEIWDKRNGKVCWLAKDYPEILDEVEDPLKLEGFFPCPKPLYATLTSGSLIPVPDYCQYEDQAKELDSITGRIAKMVKAVKANGVYNGEFKEIGRLLNEGTDNTLIGVGNWGALSEKGGLKGAIDLLDTSNVIQAIGVLANQREITKQVIYEICGISDVLRGASKADETLGAQQIKVSSGSLRMRTSQTDVARFAAEVFQIKAQIICKFYPPELIVKMSGVAALPEVQANPQIIEAAIQLLSDSTIRDFHITVESDSLAQIDEDAEKQAANEVLTTIGGFVEKALPMAQEAPETLPMVKEMLLFQLRRQRAGRNLESSIEQTFAALIQKAQGPKGPTKEQMDAQMQQQADQMRIQADTQAAQMKEQFAAQAQTAKLQAEGQLEQQKMQMELTKAKMQAQIDSAVASREQYFEMSKADKENQVKLIIADKDNATKIAVAEIAAKAKQDAQTQSLAADANAQESQQQHEAITLNAEHDHADQAQQADHSANMDLAQVKSDNAASPASGAEGEDSGDGSTAPFALGGGKAKPVAAIAIDIGPKPEEKPKPEEAPKKRKYSVVRDEKGKIAGIEEQ